MSDILVAREARSTHIQSLMGEFKFKTIAVLKLNVVGKNKNPINMRFICLLFDNEIRKEFGDKIIRSEKVESEDGDYIYYVINEEGNIVKQKTIYIEDNTYLGRLVDVDVYNETSISREDMSCEMRTCLICDNYAHICSRNQTHSQKEVLQAVNLLIEEYLTDILLNSVMHSIHDELEMFPKFGLVSKRDSGSHSDMDYETFIQSIFSIKPYIKEYILYGIRGHDNPKELQKIGLEAEEAMFKATNNINTQKGLIFALGLFLPALSKSIVNNRNEAYIISEIQRTSIEIIGDYYSKVEDKTLKTHGDQVYLDYGVKGIRGEALKGFRMLFENESHSDQEYDDKNHQYMIDILTTLCDTTVIHKKGFKTMKQIQTDMDEINKNGGYINNKELFTIISETYKKQGISPGGASDLLVLKMIYENVKYLICHSEYCGI